MSDERSRLNAEFQIFESRRKEWLQDHEGQYVVMYNGRVAGFFDEYADGLRAGITNFGVSSEFLVQRVRDEDPLLVI